MNSRSLYLHAKRVMAAVENTINALDDGEVLLESLTSLGRRHQVWFVREEHFKVWKLHYLSPRTCSLSMFSLLYNLDFVNGVDRAVPKVTHDCFGFASLLSVIGPLCRCDCYGIGFRNSFENCFNVNWPRLGDSKADVSTQRALCQSQSGNYRSRAVYDGTTLLVRRYLHEKHKIKLIEFFLKFWWKIDFCSRVFRLSVLPRC